MRHWQLPLLFTFMSCTLNILKEEAWNVFAAVKLCKALEEAFVEWQLQVSSPITVNIDATENSVHGILESVDQAEIEKVN